MTVKPAFNRKFCGKSVNFLLIFSSFFRFPYFSWNGLICLISQCFSWMTPSKLW